MFFREPELFVRVEARGQLRDEAEEDWSGDSQDYVQENVARGQERNVVTPG